MHPRHPVVANYPTEIEHLDNFSKVQSLVLFFVENTVASWFFENLLLQGWGCRGCSAPLRLSITTIWLLFLMLAGVCVLVYDAFTCVTWLITWRIDMCDMTHYMTHWHVWHDSLHDLHDSLTCVAWHVFHDSLPDSLLQSYSCFFLCVKVCVCHCICCRCVPLLIDMC